jgi:hypothetical protein
VRSPSTSTPPTRLVPPEPDRAKFCRSFGGYYRLDTDDARSFLDDFV